MGRFSFCLKAAAWAPRPKVLVPPAEGCRFFCRYPFLGEIRFSYENRPQRKKIGFPFSIFSTGGPRKQIVEPSQGPRSLRSPKAVCLKWKSHWDSPVVQTVLEGFGPLLSETSARFVNGSNIILSNVIARTGRCTSLCSNTIQPFQEVHQRPQIKTPAYGEPMIDIPGRRCWRSFQRAFSLLRPFSPVAGPHHTACQA